MKAIGYTRVSTVEQADSGLGLEAQAERIKAYCALKGMYLAEIVTDAGVSGGKPLGQREGGERLLAALHGRPFASRVLGARGGGPAAGCPGRVKAVVMLKLDRGFRDAGDCLTTVDQWEKAGIALHVVDLGGNAIDTTSAAGRFMLVVLAGAAEMERNLTREKTRSALAVKKANGERAGAIPFGYDLDLSRPILRRNKPPTYPLVENPAEQAVIAEIRSMRTAGMRLQPIARTLSTRGVPTKTGRSDRWSHQAVARILRRGA